MTMVKKVINVLVIMSAVLTLNIIPQLKERIMRKFIVLPLILLFATSAFAQTDWFKGTFDEAKAAAEKESKLILINFTSPT